MLQGLQNRRGDSLGGTGAVSALDLVVERIAGPDRIAAIVVERIGRSIHGARDARNCFQRSPRGGTALPVRAHADDQGPQAVEGRNRLLNRRTPTLGSGGTTPVDEIAKR